MTEKRVPARQTMSLWFENADGDVFDPFENGDPPAETPPGFIYMHTQSTRTIVHRVVMQDGSDKWVPVVTGSTSYPADLVLAMCRPTWLERLRQVLRTGRFTKTYGYAAAQLLAANSCERCLNVFLYEHGTVDGYARGSDKWKQCPTSCELCAP